MKVQFPYLKITKSREVVAVRQETKPGPFGAWDPVPAQATVIVVILAISPNLGSA